MLLPTSSVGRKIMMAISGQILVIFIVFHISGNSSIFFHKLNAYVAALYTLPVFVWGGRIVLALAFILHLWYGTILKLENRAAKPQSYIVTNYRRATFAGRYQIWTGVIVAAFLIYHLLQFTFQVTNPQIAADRRMDALGRPDVFMMVVRSFQQIGISGIYIVSLAALGLHLFHGIQSSFQTWGLTNEKTLPVFEKTGTVASVILFSWYIAIPVAIVVGILQ
ncbi:MAG TPA: succinate dehydrogenase cytochrome b subunit [Nitrospirota bacterium]|nr:succinate dehydrogenase cytochrome b subunit [Nitrospirota bacterium]